MRDLTSLQYASLLISWSQEIDLEHQKKLALDLQATLHFLQKLQNKLRMVRAVMALVRKTQSKFTTKILTIYSVSQMFTIAINEASIIIKVILRPGDSL